MVLAKRASIELWMQAGRSSEIISEVFECHEAKPAALPTSKVHP